MVARNRSIIVFFSLLIAILGITSIASAATELSYEGKVFSVKVGGSDYLDFYVDNVGKTNVLVNTMEDYVKYDGYVLSVDSIQIDSTLLNQYSIPTPEIVVNWTQYRSSGSVKLVYRKSISSLITGTIVQPTLSSSGNTVTIQYPAEAKYKKYRIDSGLWKDYTTPINVLKGRVQAISGDKYGNVSTLAYLDINDTPPDIQLSVSPLTPSQNATVKAKITSQNSIIDKKYIFGAFGINNFPDHAELLPNNNQFDVTKNGTWTVMAKDNKGFITVKSIIVTNVITAPEIIKNTNDLARSLSITISSSLTDKATILYKINDGDWVKYSEPFKIYKNCKIYATTTDSKGNISRETVLEIKNIIQKTEYIYNEKGALVRMITNNGTYSYDYDSNGNILKITKQK